MVHADLFTGAGGFSLAAEWMDWQNLFHCEIEKYKRDRLKINFPNSVSHDDITTTDFTIYRGRVNVLTGGFPCQDASFAKQWGEGQQGLRGSRTGLASHMLRSVSEIRPEWVVAENVENILRTNGGRDFQWILSELAGMGYNAEWRVCRASDVGAPHHRPRLYIVAYSNRIRLKKGETFFSHVRQEIGQAARPWVFNGAAVRLFRGGTWESEPPVLCVDDGVSSQLVRRSLHGYGNAVIPQMPYKIFKSIQEYEQQHRITKQKVITTS